MRTPLALATLLALLPAGALAQTPPVGYGLPDREYATPPPPRVYASPPPTYVVPAPRPVVISPPPPVVVVERNPYDTEGLAIVGTGFGGLLIKTDQGSILAASVLAHLGLAVGAAEFSLRANFMPDALELSSGKLDLYATRAAFNYRFLERAVVHPIAGLGLEWIAGVPEEGGTGHAFAAVSRVGMELAFPLRTAALALGLDCTFHLPFAASESFPVNLELLLGFGAYLDYRF